MCFLLPAFAAIHFLCYWLRYEFQMGHAEFERFWLSVGWVAWIKLVLFQRYRICRGWSRPVAFYDLVVLIKAALVSLAVMVLIDQFLLPAVIVPRSVLLLDCGMTICFLGGVRTLTRHWREKKWLAGSAARRPSGC